MNKIETSEVHKNIVDYWNIKPPFKAKSENPTDLKEWYDSISEHRYTVVPYMKGYVGFEKFKGKSILEIGCGAGTDLCEFARHGAMATGIDITDKAVELTNQRLKVEGLQGKAVKYNGREIPAEDNSLDLVYSWGVLHHTPYMEDLFAEAYRVLKPGGQLKMMLYNRISILYYYSILYLRKIKAQKMTESREAMLSMYSEFRSGCPMTKVVSEDEAKGLLWFFKNVETAVDYPVYDSEDDRKVDANKVFNIEKTGVADVDLFFAKFNEDVKAKKDIRKYGWHLLVTATK